MAAKSSPPKRANRTQPLGESLGRALDSAFKKRGFASRDLIAHWAVIAPAHIAGLTLPDRMVWPRRGGASAEGATLYLRCREGHAMAVEHEGAAIAAAINRYFGYFLIASVKPAALPLVPDAPAPAPAPPALTPAQKETLAGTLAPVEDPELRDALARLGEALMRRPNG